MKKEQKIKIKIKIYKVYHHHLQIEISIKKKPKTKIFQVYSNNLIEQIWLINDKYVSLDKILNFI